MYSKHGILIIGLSCMLLACSPTQTTAVASPAEKSRRPYKIALEEHVAFRDMWPLFNDPNPPLPWAYALTDLENGRLEERISAMDRGNIDVMVLSVPGGTQNMKNKTTAAADLMKYNKKLAEGVAKYPKRFMFWCMLPMFDVHASIAQLTWCMRQPSCPGAMINGYSTDGPSASPNYYDTPEYDPFWQAVQQLNAKIYFHPREAEARPLWQDFPELRGNTWGFSLETGEHMLRFILSGFFDKFPAITLVIGHNGEMITYWADRIDHRLAAVGWKRGTKPPSPDLGLHARNYTVTEALRRNFYITTSGMFNDAGLMHAIAVMGADRVMFSLDYPYEDTVAASAWFDAATAKMKISDVNKVAHGNAEQLLGILN